MTIKNIFLYIACFMLVVPSLFFFFKTNEIEGFKSENQAPLEFNKKRPFEMFDTYYKNNFAFRNILAQQYLNFNANYSKTSSLPDRVVVGKDGWYFLGDFWNDNYSEAIGVAPQDIPRLDATVQRVLEMQHFCDSLGIKFYYFMPPNSHTINAKYLPVVPNHRQRNIDYIFHALQNKVECVDVRKELIAQNQNSNLYYKTDSHWNSNGAFIGAQKLLSTIKKDFPNTTVPDKRNYTISQKKINQMDLTKMLKEYSDDMEYTYREKVKPSFQVKMDTINKILQRRVLNSKNAYKVVIFRDSFFEHLLQFTDNTFHEILYLSSPIFYKQKVMEEKPDFVIFEIVERNSTFSGTKIE